MKILCKAGFSHLIVLLRVLIHISKRLPLTRIYISPDSLVQNSEDLLLRQSLRGQSIIDEFDLLLGKSLLHIFSGLLFQILLFLVLDEGDPIGKSQSNFGKVAE